MKILIASENKNKIKEFKEILEPLGYEVLSAKDVNIDMSSLIENGETFNDNALLKANFLYQKTKLPSIADDSGLVVKSLPNILGVHSARFLENESYDVKNKEVIIRLENKEDRSAYFKSAIAYVSEVEKVTFEGQIDGEITFEPKGSLGFGYDPIFKPQNFEETFGEISADVKNEISHRAKALQKFMRYMYEK